MNNLKVSGRKEASEGKGGEGRGALVAALAGRLALRAHELGEEGMILNHASNGGDDGRSALGLAEGSGAGSSGRGEDELEGERRK